MSNAMKGPRPKRIGIPLLLVLLLLPAAAASAEVTLRASWEPDRVSPGSVVPVLVEAPLELYKAEAVTGGERFPMVPVSGGTWMALVGISDEYDQPVYRVDLELFPDRGGVPYRIRADLKLLEKTFGKTTQSLDVDDDMVNYTTRNLARIRADSRAAREARSRRLGRRFWSGAFVMPVEGPVTTRFGTGRVLNGQRRSPHSGVDIAAPAATPVGAANAGVVALAREMYLSGNTVIIDHGWGLFTIYAHLQSITVRPGQVVRRRETIGRVGSTGRSTGPHLHLGAYVRDARVDPVRLIEATAGLGE